MRHRSMLAIAAAALTLVAASASAAPVPLATDAAGGVTAAGDVIAWSAYDPVGGNYRLIVNRAGVTAPLPVAPAKEPFDVSAGIGPDKAVWLAWSRCGSAGCRVVRWDVADPGERAVPATRRAGWSASHPAIDGGRVAFARTRARVVQVVVARLAGAPAPQVVRAALPSGLCTGDDPRGPACARPGAMVIVGIALHGDGLAVSARASSSAGAPGLCGLAGLRYVDLRTGVARRITDTVCGLAGATIAPPSFDARGRLWFARACNSTKDACRGPQGSPTRYEPATGTALGTTIVRDGSLRAVAPAPAGLVLSRWGAGRTPGCALEDGFGCAVVTVVPLPAFTESPLALPRAPDAPLVAVRTFARARVLRPAPRVPCQVADPHPHPGADIWGGAVAPPGHRWTMSVRAAGGHSAGRRITAAAGWRFAHVSLSGRGVCGSTVAVTYRIDGDRPLTFTVHVDPARG